jgi:cytochrome c-type protein NapC
MSDNTSSNQGQRLYSRKYILTIIVVFFAGIAAFGGFNTILAHTNEMEFCTSCHSMKINLEEYKETVHYKNASGVQATCADCHVPKSFLPKMKAKILAYKDVMHEFLGTIDTKEKYESHRWEMASSVWAKMQANDSLVCRNCHSIDNMEFSEQDRSARKKHPRAQLKGQTCIDCHKGIAHEEPDEPEEEDEASHNT